MAYPTSKPYPVTKVYVAFADGPYVANPTWTEITSYVRHVETSRGRPNDWSAMSGSATVVLNNRTRAFDAFNTSGPYYGQLLPRRQIKIESTTWTDSGTAWVTGTTYPVFRGYIQGWPEAWTDAGGDSTVTIHCFDALQLLGSSNVTYDWAYYNIMTTLFPAYYWKLDEPCVPNAANTLYELGAKYYGTANRSLFNMTTTTTVLNGDQLAYGLANTSVRSTNYLASTSQTSVQSTTASDFAFCFWCIPEATDSTSSCFYGWFQGWNVSADFAQTANGGKWQFTIANTTATYQFSSSIANLNAGQPHHVGLSWVSATATPTVYIDGVAGTSAKTTTGAIIVPDQTESYGLAQGQFQQLIVWLGAVPANYFQTVIYWSQAQFPETTAARMDRLIAQTPYPASLYSKPTSPQGSVLDIGDNGPSVAAELQLVADTEGGPLFVTRSGVLTMFNRYQQFTQSTSFNVQLALSNGTTGLGENLTLALDGDSMRNRFTVTTSGGGYWTTDYSTSQNNYGIAGQNIDTQSQTVPNAQNLGLLFGGLGQYVYPTLSETSVVVNPFGNWDAALAMELLDRFSVNLVLRTGTPIYQQMLLSNVRYVAGPDKVELFFQGSVRFASAFRLDNSSINGPDVILYTG